MIPNANFIHLTRHPIPATKSIDEFRERIKKHTPDGETSSYKNDDPLLFWYKTHNIIMDFMASLPEGQALRIAGEELLQEHDKYLIQISEWLGLRSDPDAIEAMKHPEYSPYACVGPINARFGNDRKFLMSPELRSAKFKLPRLDTHTYYENIPDEHKPEILNLTHQLGYI